MQNDKTKAEEMRVPIEVLDLDVLRGKIYEVRGQKVMLDLKLAEIYGYSTKNFNRQVKNNISKFEGEDFMFQLSASEWEILRCKICTSSWAVFAIYLTHLPNRVFICS